MALTLLRRPLWLALLILILVILWMISGGAPITAQRDAPAPEAVATETDGGPMRVSVVTSVATPISREVRLQGQVEPGRHVQLKAQTSGRVVGLPVARGQPVAEGALLVQLSTEERPARLAQAEAELRQIRHALNAAQTLRKRDLQSQSRLLELQAQFAAAEAARESARLDLAHSRISAPFAGILDLRPLELGDFVERGDPVATLVDVQTLLVTAQVPQSQLGELRLGQAAQVQLAQGLSLAGTLTYIATQGEAGTRSFRVEVQVANPEGRRLAGRSATLVLPIETVMAHAVSPALLSLGNRGQLEIKGVDAQQRVQAYPVQMVRASADGIWLQGLPERVQLISLGQGFVAPGERVEPVMAPAP